jgi:hypothetical protein
LVYACHTGSRTMFVVHLGALLIEVCAPVNLH